MDKVIVHDGCRISYTVVGRGPVVLFIQGVGVQGAGWSPQTDELQKSYTCVSFDSRGIARSQPQVGEITVRQMASDALAVLEAEGISAAHVVGHSLGGLIGLQLALDARERVRSISLLCSFTGSRTVAPLSLRMVWLGLGARIGTRSMRRRGFLRLLLPPGGVANVSAMTALFGHDLADLPTAGKAQLRALRRVDLSDRLGELTDLPALVVSSKHDPIAPPRAGKAIRDRLRNAKYVEFSDASHGLPITHSTQINSLLLQHLSAAEASSRLPSVEPTGLVTP